MTVVDVNRSNFGTAQVRAAIALLLSSAKSLPRSILMVVFSFKLLLAMKVLTTSEKVAQAVRFMRSVNTTSNCFLAFSGGKDSMVLKFIAKEAGIKVPLKHNVTTIDPEGTISFCLKHGAELIRNKRTFLDIVEQKGMPTMFRRFCCKELKEKYIGDKGFFGIRRDESVKRSNCYDDFSDIYYYSKKVHTERFFPLLQFSDDDIYNVVTEHSLECHPLYYDHQGHFCVNRRLGCIGCPLQGDRGKMDYLKYPKLLKQVLKRLVIFHKNHGRTARDAYLNAVYNLFYSNHGFERYRQTYEGLFDTDPVEMLNEYFFLNLKVED